MPRQWRDIKSIHRLSASGRYIRLRWPLRGASKNGKSRFACIRRRCVVAVSSLGAMPVRDMTPLQLVTVCHEYGIDWQRPMVYASLAPALAARWTQQRTPKQLRLARMCGNYAAAKYLLNREYSLADALHLLTGRL